MKFDGQVALFDVTIPEANWDSWQNLALRLNEVAKKWCFQKEKGDETGYIHWQVRLSLHKKTTCVALLRDIIPQLPGHWSVTSNGTHGSGNVFNYCMKVQTRVDGPWTDREEVREAPVLTDQLVEFFTHEPYLWQAKGRALAEIPDFRKIIYFYDPHYNSGKSIFCEWLEYNRLAEEIPPFTLMEDIMQFVFCMPKAKCYCFDMPAAMKKEKMHQMYSGLEMLKNGFLYDKRYNGKKQRISRPLVMCFANNLPIQGLIAPDRFKVYYITPDKDLVEYDPDLHPFHIQEIHDIQGSL